MSAFIYIVVMSAVAIAAILGIALRDVPRVVRSLRKGRRVRARVVQDEGVSVGYGRMYFPVVVFRDESGVEREVKTRYPQMAPPWERADEVTIAYLPGDPEGTTVLVGLRPYRLMVLEAVMFLAITGAIPVMLWWAQG